MSTILFVSQSKEQFAAAQLVAFFYGYKWFEAHDGNVKYVDKWEYKKTGNLLFTIETKSILYNATYGEKVITSLDELTAALYSSPILIKVNGVLHPVQIDTVLKEISVGCTKVPFATVDRIYEEIHK